MSKISPDGDVYQAGTLSGNPVAMAAGIAQLKECLRKDFYKKLEKKTKLFTDSIKKLITGNRQLARNQQPAAGSIKIFSIGSIFWLAFTEKENIKSAAEIDPNSMQHFRKLYHQLLENSIYLGPSGYEVGFVSEAHTESDLKKAAKIISENLREL
jgi:glutamate-1-semialdehyde 2,1-aminomutase